MRQEIVHASLGNVHVYGGGIIDRVISFNRRHNLKADPDFVMVELTNQMVATEPWVLIQAILNDDGVLVGHCVTLLQELFGVRSAMIYQLEIDESETDGREEMLRLGWDQIETWADNHRCKSIRAWAMSKKLARVFHRFGLENKDYQFVEVDI